MRQHGFELVYTNCEKDNSDVKIFIDRDELKGIFDYISADKIYDRNDHYTCNHGTAIRVRVVNGAPKGTENLHLKHTTDIGLLKLTGEVNLPYDKKKVLMD